MKIFRGNQGSFTRVALLLGVLALIGSAGQTVKADPLMFSNTRVFQNNSSTQIDLFSNQIGLIYGPYLSFRVDITGTLTAGATDTLQITYAEAGYAPQIHNYQIPLFGTVNPPLTLFFSFVSQGANAQGNPATLTLDLLSSSPDFVIPSGPNAGQLTDSHTYSFNVGQPVPEPATMILFGSGLAFLASRRRKTSS